MRVWLWHTTEGWKVRFGAGNKWRMPIGEWLHLPGKDEATDAAGVEEHVTRMFPGAQVFTLVSRNGLRFNHAV
jgi:hypothetical protein